MPIQTPHGNPSAYWADVAVKVKDAVFTLGEACREACIIDHESLSVYIQQELNVKRKDVFIGYLGWDGIFYTFNQMEDMLAQYAYEHQISYGSGDKVFWNLLPH